MTGMGGGNRYGGHACMEDKWVWKRAVGMKEGGEHGACSFSLLVAMRKPPR